MITTFNELVLFVAGAIFTIIGIRKIYKRRKLVKTGIKVAGVVFRMEEEFKVKSFSYYPVIRYVTLEKEWITERYDVGSSPAAYKEGDTVKVIYDTVDNKQFIIDSWQAKLFEFLFLIGGVSLIIGAIIYYILHQL
jgi:hypothetical protein